MKNFKFNPINLSVAAGFLLFFFYGALLLLIGFTNSGLQGLTGLEHSQTIILAVPQSVGLITGTVCLKWLLQKTNIRNLLFVSYLFTISCLVLISQFDRVMGVYNTPLDHLTQTQKTNNLVVFCVITYIYGLSISMTSPIISTYFSAIFKGKMRSTMLSTSSGFYSIGGGAIPLIAAKFIISLNAKGGFNEIRYFYYLATGAAVLMLLSSLLINYRHKTEALSFKFDTAQQKIPDNEITTTLNQFNRRNYLWACGLIILSFIFYMLSETIVNYAFVSKIGYGGSANNPTQQIKIYLTTGFGLLLFVEGLFRIIGGLTFTRWFKFKTILTFNGICIFIGLALLSIQVKFHSVAIIYLSAVFLGAGIGNSWPILFAFGSGVNNYKASLTGVLMNIVSMMTIPLFQIISAFTPALVLTILGALAGILMIFLVWVIVLYLRKIGISHPDEVTSHSKPVFLTTKKVKSSLLK